MTFFKFIESSKREEIATFKEVITQTKEGDLVRKESPLFAKAMMSGLNLTETSHIVLLDTLNADKDTSRVIEEQAIGRAVRLGQQKTVQVQRFIMRDKNIMLINMIYHQLLI